MRAPRPFRITALIGALAVMPLLPGTYTVSPGDTLSGIAARHGSTTAALASANGVANPDLILVGSTLTIPSASAGGSSVAPKTGATHHHVRPGETISGIAARHGIPQAQLIAANGITNGVIYAGQQLMLVPAPGATGARSGSYTVRSGDTLSGIAQRLGTSVRALAAANGMTDPDRVVIGRKLNVPAGGSTLPCPVQGRVTVMNDWGFPRSGGRFHEGNDLFAPRGTPVIAVVSGTVAQKTGPVGGRQVKLTGNDGVSYYGTHLDAFGHSGQVSAGTVIGYVGSSGNAAGGAPHLHFEVHPGGGQAVNPYPRIAGAC
jgi:murein DD-endopeptidase MepM/ murein hydrolase activator NlpD